LLKSCVEDQAVELIFILILIAMGVMALDTIRKEFRKLKNKVKKFLRGSEQTYVSPHKRTTNVRGYYRGKQKKKNK